MLILSTIAESMPTPVFKKLFPGILILPTVALLLSAFMTWANAQAGTPFLSTWARNFATSIVFLPVILMGMVQIEKLLARIAPQLRGNMLKLVVSLLGALFIESLLAAVIAVISNPLDASWFGFWWRAFSRSLPVGLLVGLFMGFYMKPKIEEMKARAAAAA